MKILIEGWRGINHSYAIVNQWQMLGLLAKGVELRHHDVPYFNPKWNVQANRSGLEPGQEQAIANILPPHPGEQFDAIYRIAFPINIAASADHKVAVFGTTEAQSVDGMFSNGSPADLPKRDNIVLITPSHWSRAGFLRAGIAESRVRVVPHGIAPATFYPLAAGEEAGVRKALAIPPDAFVLASIGAMTHNKGVDILLIAFAILRQRYRNLFLILKDQSNLYDIQAQTWLRSLMETEHHTLFDQHVIAGLRFVSENLDFAMLRRVYCSADLYVSPYRAEGFNLPPLEAAACGTPILVTKGGPTDDYFDPVMGRQIESALVHDVGDTQLAPSLDSLIHQISEMIENRDDSARPAASRHVHINHSWGRVSEALLRELA